VTPSGIGAALPNAIVPYRGVKTTAAPRCDVGRVRWLLMVSMGSAGPMRSDVQTGSPCTSRTAGVHPAWASSPSAGERRYPMRPPSNPSGPRGKGGRQGSMGTSRHVGRGTQPPRIPSSASYEGGRAAWADNTAVSSKEAMPKHTCASYPPPGGGR
jgi:hypothetical protein